MRLLINYTPTTTRVVLVCFDFDGMCCSRKFQKQNDSLALEGCLDPHTKNVRPMLLPAAELSWFWWQICNGNQVQIWPDREWVKWVHYLEFKQALLENISRNIEGEVSSPTKRIVRDWSKFMGQWDRDKWNGTTNFLTVQFIRD